MNSDEQKIVIDVLKEVRSKIRGLSNRGLRNFTNYGEDEMRSRCSEVVSEMIKSLEKSNEETHAKRN